MASKDRDTGTKPEVIKDIAAAPFIGARETITMVVRQLPEGVWLTTSDDLPGLIVETETRDEAVDLARELALELLEAERREADRRHQKFAFIYQ
jgi:predicted RNase H-like HicB family nuclease